MIITFKPQRRDDNLTLEKQGDILLVNGVPYDFEPLPEGATLPADAIGSDLFCGPVERIDGVLRLIMILPHGPNPPESVAFPEPITITQDGPVEVPQ